MPSVSRLQHRFMEIAKHDKQFAKQHHIKQETAREFVDADKRADKFQNPASNAERSAPKK